MQILAVPWVQLPGQQNILIQALFTEVDYCIRVTDLQTIWGEDVTKTEVQERADFVDCPIDAYSNLKELLKYLQDGLTVDSTSVEIVLNRHKDLLQLTTTEEIGSTKLEWNFELAALPYSAVASGLTLALFSMMSFYQREVASLLEVIHDKDNVIHQMGEFHKTANLVFKPNRRQKAYNKFDKDEWLKKCRSKAEKDTRTSQDVIDELSLVGREAEFRRDWRAVLTEISNWEVRFLPQTTQRLPGTVTSSCKKKARTSKLQDPLQYTPTLVRNDTNQQSREFVSPTASRMRGKTKIKTKWSSPVPSSSIGKDSDADEELEPDLLQGDGNQQMDFSSPSASPTPRRNMKANAKQFSAEHKTANVTEDLPKYKLRDNRESQELEQDIDLNIRSSQPQTIDLAGKSSESSTPRVDSDHTTDESDEDLDNIQVEQIPSSEPAHAENHDRNMDCLGSQRSDGRGLRHDQDRNPTDIQRAESSRPSRNSTQSPASVPRTPQKSRVLNVISPRTPKVTNVIKNPQETIVSQTTARSKLAHEADAVDPDVAQRTKAQEKRKQLERLMSQSPEKKRTRRF